MMTSLLDKPTDALKMIRRTLLNDAASESYAKELLARAGITVGGDRAVGHAGPRRPRFYTRVLRDGTLGFGESYVDGWWDSAALDQTIDEDPRGAARRRGARELADDRARDPRARAQPAERGPRVRDRRQATTTSATISTRRCSTSACCTRARTGRTRRPSTTRRTPSSTSCAASSALAPGMTRARPRLRLGRLRDRTRRSTTAARSRATRCRKEQVALRARRATAHLPIDVPPRRLPQGQAGRTTPSCRSG